MLHLYTEYVYVGTNPSCGDTWGRVCALRVASWYAVYSRARARCPWGPGFPTGTFDGVSFFTCITRQHLLRGEAALPHGPPGNLEGKHTGGHVLRRGRNGHHLLRLRRSSEHLGLGGGEGRGLLDLRCCRLSERRDQL